jgi:hypothetical protein
MGLQRGIVDRERRSSVLLVVATLALNRIFLWTLMDLERQQSSACVSVTSGKARRVVHVMAGQLVGAESNLKTERLGDMLVSEGLLDPILLEPVAAEASRRKTLLGEQLVNDGLMTPTDLLAALDRQVSFRMGAALSMRGVVQVEPPKGLQPSVQVPMTVAVAGAFRQWVPLAAIENELMFKDDEEQPVALDGASPVLASLELGPAELRLTRRLAAGEKLEGILASGQPREPVLRLAGALRAVNLWR